MFQCHRRDYAISQGLTSKLPKIISFSAWLLSQISSCHGCPERQTMDKRVAEQPHSQQQRAGKEGALMRKEGVNEKRMNFGPPTAIGCWEGMSSPITYMS